MRPTQWPFRGAPPISRKGTPGLRSRGQWLAPRPDDVSQMQLRIEAPSESDLPVHPRDLVIAIDGAQDPSELAVSLAAARALIADLRPGDRFNLVQANQSGSLCWTKSQPPTAANVHAAETWLQSVRPGQFRQLGGLIDAIAQSPPRGRLPMVVWLTDGERLDGWRNLRRHAGDVRIFALVTDGAAHHAPVRSLAQQTRGAVVVHPVGGAPEETVRAIVARVGRPLLVDWSLGESEMEVWLTDPIPDLYAGYPVFVHGLFRWKGSDPVVPLVGRAPGPHQRGMAKTVSVRVDTPGSSAIAVGHDIHRVVELFSTTPHGLYASLAAKVALEGPLATRDTPLIPMSEPSVCGPARAVFESWARRQERLGRPVPRVPPWRPRETSPFD